jgi:hypothetical protein
MAAGRVPHRDHDRTLRLVAFLGERHHPGERRRRVVCSAGGRQAHSRGGVEGLLSDSVEPHTTTR